MGEKHPTADMTVELLDPTGVRSLFYVQVKSTTLGYAGIGSGDCLLAGLVDARLAGLGPEAMLRRAVAAAVSNAMVWDAGAIAPEEVSRLEEGVIVES
jgi:fructose-1-phosphate kinase PfkB-like protein